MMGFSGNARAIFLLEQKRIAEQKRLEEEARKRANSTISSSTQVRIGEADFIMLEEDPFAEAFPNKELQKKIIQVLNDFESKDERSIQNALCAIIMDEKKSILTNSGTFNAFEINEKKTLGIINWIIKNNYPKLLTTCLTLSGVIQCLTLAHLRKAVSIGSEAMVKQLLALERIKQDFIKDYREILTIAEKKDQVIAKLLARSLQSALSNPSQSAQLRSGTLKDSLKTLILWFIDQDYINLLSVFLTFAETQQLLGREIVAIQSAAGAATNFSGFMLKEANKKSAAIADQLITAINAFILLKQVSDSSAQTDRFVPLIKWMIRENLFNLLKQTAKFPAFVEAMEIADLLKLAELNQTEVIAIWLGGDDLTLLKRLLAQHPAKPTLDGTQPLAFKNITHEGFIYEILNAITSRIRLIEDQRIINNASTVLSEELSMEQLIKWMLGNDYRNFMRVFITFPGMAEKVTIEHITILLENGNTSMLQMMIAIPSIAGKVFAEPLIASQVFSQPSLASQISAEHIDYLIEAGDQTMCTFLTFPDLTEKVTAAHIAMVLTSGSNLVLQKMVAIPAIASKVSVEHINELIETNNQEKLKILLGVDVIARKVSVNLAKNATSNIAIFDLLFNSPVVQEELAFVLGKSPTPLTPLYTQQTNTIHSSLQTGVNSSSDRSVQEIQAGLNKMNFNH